MIFHLLPFYNRLNDIIESPYRKFSKKITDKAGDSALCSKLGDFEMTIDNVRKYFNHKKNTYKSDEEHAEEFQQLANGVFQAEGYIGGHFKSGLNFYPLCTVTQLLSEESIEFFIRLNNNLSNKGTVSITLNSFNKFVIHFRLSGWNVFFSEFIPYFYMLYGAKYDAIAKLTRIYKIKESIQQSKDEMLIVELISLAYSLTAHASRYKLSLKNKLISLNIKPELLDNLPQISSTENTILPSFLFLLGFFLGDGTLHLKLEWREKNKTIVIIPTLSIDQSAVESNIKVMNYLLEVLNINGVSARLHKRADVNVYVLNASGIENIFINLFPLLEKHVELLYWKSDSFKLFTWVKTLTEIGGHHTYLGLSLLIEKLYSNTHERLTEKKTWVERLDIWLKTVNSRRDAGNYYIYPIYVANTREVRGWQVRFATSLTLPEKSNRAFMCSSHGGSAKALELAISYREIVIFEMLERAGLTSQY